MVKLEENTHGNEGFPGDLSGRGSERRGSEGRGSEERGTVESDFPGLDEGSQEETELSRGEKYFIYRAKLRS